VIINKIELSNKLNSTNKSNQNRDLSDSGGLNFAEMVKGSLREVNTDQKVSEKAMSDIATGQVKDLHQAALSINKAETSMKVMLEVRNKALSAYKEILRTQI
jgi:flagellar hook-basal body complex protein FliE